MNISVEEIKSSLKEIKENFQPKKEPEYLTRQDVAKLFKIDLSTVHNLTKKGELKAPINTR